MNRAVRSEDLNTYETGANITPTRKRALGAYYTPLAVSQALCAWAIRSPNDSVLEPCFGGCTFIEASVQRLKALGAANPPSNVYGCDIDPMAFRYLKERVPGLVDSTQFILKDFLTLSPGDIRTDLVDAVVGNPPYVSLQRLSAPSKAAVSSWEARYGQVAAKRSSIWVHFTLHALHFLKQGGRLAWVLPGAFLTAKYSYAARASLLANFSKVAFVSLAERLFLDEGTEERTVIVLAEGYGSQGAGNRAVSVCLEETSELQEFICSWEKMDWAKPAVSSSAGLVPSRSADLIATLSESDETRMFGDLADVEIGAVAGDTKFLIKSKSAWEAIGISPRHLTYIVPQSRRLDGLILRLKDKAQHDQDGARCQALNVSAGVRSRPVRRYLDSYSANEIAKNATFQKRSVWHKFLDDRIPDAFFVFMTHMGPRLVLNDVKSNATNALYRVNFKRGMKKHEKLVTISLQTTFTQVAAELLGHYRGSGALKLEPSDVRRLPIYLPEVSDTEVSTAFREIDTLVRSGRHENARKYADSFIFSRAASFNKFISTLQEDLEIARRRRVRNIGERRSHE